MTSPLAPDSSLPPTVSSAAEPSPIDGPAVALWDQLEQSWSSIAHYAGLHSPAIRPRLGADFPQQARTLASAEGDVLLHRGPGEWWFRYADGLSCRVAIGDPPRIDLESRSPASLQQITRLAGPLTAMLMDLCGFYPLHASGLLLGDRMLAVCGRAGAGKSTVTAMMAASGIPVAGDDLLPLDSGGRIVGIGGSLRIMPDHAPRGWEPLAHLPDGRGWYSLPSLPTAPLAGILLLERGPRIQVEAVRGADRLLAIVRSGYLSHLDLSPAASWHEHIVEIAGKVDVFRLVVPDTLDALSRSREQLHLALESLVA